MSFNVIFQIDYSIKEASNLMVRFINMQVEFLGGTRCSGPNSEALTWAFSSVSKAGSGRRELRVASAFTW